MPLCIWQGFSYTLFRWKDSWDDRILLQAVVFYGSSFAPLDLPIPRQPWHDWALLHEESPKNNPSFCYHPLISLFNYTATWSRKSSFPLTLLSLPKLSDITGISPVSSCWRIVIFKSLCFFTGSSKWRQKIFCFCCWQECNPSSRGSFTGGLCPVFLWRSLWTRLVCYSSPKVYRHRLLRKMSKQQTSPTTVR